MGNCAFPRDEKSTKYNVSAEEWENFVRRAYRSSKVESNPQIDSKEIWKRIASERCGPPPHGGAIQNHRIYLGPDFLTYGQELDLGGFRAEDFHFGTVTSAGCAPAINVQLHMAKLEKGGEAGAAIQFLISQRSGKDLAIRPRAYLYPVPADQQEAAATYVEGWKKFEKPLEHQGRTLQVGSEDMEKLWPTLVMQRMLREARQVEKPVKIFIESDDWTAFVDRTYTPEALQQGGPGAGLREANREDANNSSSGASGGEAGAAASAGKKGEEDEGTPDGIFLKGTPKEKDNLNTKDLDPEEVRKRLTATKHEQTGMNIAGHSVVLGADYLTFGQVLSEVNNPGRGKFQGHDFIFGADKQSVDSTVTRSRKFGSGAEQKISTLHCAMIDDKTKTLKVVMSTVFKSSRNKAEKKPVAVTVPIPDDQMAAAKSYVEMWQPLCAPLEYQGKILVDPRDFSNMWSTWLLMDMMVLSSCFMLLMMMDPMMYGGMDGDMGGGGGGDMDFGSMLLF